MQILKRCGRILLIDGLAATDDCDCECYTECDICATDGINWCKVFRASVQHDARVQGLLVSELPWYGALPPVIQCEPPGGWPIHNWLWRHGQGHYVGIPNTPTQYAPPLWPDYNLLFGIDASIECNSVTGGLDVSISVGYQAVFSLGTLQYFLPATVNVAFDDLPVTFDLADLALGIPGDPFILALLGIDTRDFFAPSGTVTVGLEEP